MADETPEKPTGVNSAHVIATGSTTALLAGVLVWLSSWPLKPLDATTAADLAGLLVAAGGGVMAFLQRRREHPETDQKTTDHPSP